MPKTPEITDSDSRLFVRVNKAPYYDLRWILDIRTKTGSRFARAVRDVTSYSLPSVGDESLVPHSVASPYRRICEVSRVIWDPYTKSGLELSQEKRWSQWEKYWVETTITLPNITDFNQFTRWLLTPRDYGDMEQITDWMVDLEPGNPGTQLVGQPDQMSRYKKESETWSEEEHSKLEEQEIERKDSR